MSSTTIYQLLYDPVSKEITYGVAGTQGPQGSTLLGIQGFQGLGFQGSQGSQGIQGFGFQGAQGVQGFQCVGLQGTQGVQGFGAQGFQGSQGFQGYQGLVGIFPTNVDNIAIGISAGFQNQASKAIAIGFNAGFQNQGQFSIALGYQAGFQQQVSNSIILNATNTPLNAGTTGFFVNPIRFNQGPPITLGRQGLQGSQGIQGIWGTQGFFGNQGIQGLAGVMGSLAGAVNQIQYNSGGNFGASTNLTFNPSTTVFTFGSGQTGGQFNVVGNLVQGITGTTGQSGNTKFAYRNVGRFIEIGADAANTAYIDFHSNDNSDVDYDTRILSINGSGSAGGGSLNFYANSGYVFTGSNTTVSIPYRINFASGADRTYTVTKTAITGSLSSGGATPVQVFTTTQGGFFNCMANNAAGNVAMSLRWGVKTAPTTYIFNEISAYTNTSGVTWTYSTTGGWTFNLTNNGTGNIVYYEIDYLQNPNYA